MAVGDGFCNDASALERDPADPFDSQGTLGVIANHILSRGGQAADGQAWQRCRCQPCILLQMLQLLWLPLLLHAELIQAGNPCV